MTPFKLTRVASLKTVADFRAHCAALGLDLPIEDGIEAGAGNPLSQPVDRVRINGKRIGNRIYRTYEKSLSTAEDLVRVSYQLTRNWSVRTESSTTDAVDLLYTLSFD